MRISSGMSAASLLTAHQSTITQQEKVQMSTEKVIAPSVKVSISKEGREYYRKSVSQKEYNSYEDVLHQREQLKDANFVNMNYSGQLWHEAGRLNSEATEELSTVDRADNLVKAYAKMYDEIVQGYENGTREVWVEDENGFRKVTKDEELSALDTAYAKLADDFVEMEKANKQSDEILYKEMSKIARISRNPERAIDFLEAYEKRKDDVIPEDLNDKMLSAVALFKSNYALLRSNTDRLALLWPNLKVMLGSD